ncbi:hypothetical protein H0H93_009685 [Arthromyces matolae]|nr:hypothetical protein H0H93_009685 [Arthromyces matolae]
MLSNFTRAPLQSSRLRTIAAVNRNLKLSSQRRNFVSVIQQGTQGWRLTWVLSFVLVLAFDVQCEHCSLGRNPVKLEPGLNLSIPILHQVLVIDLRESSISIPNLTGYTSDNVPVTCSGSLFYRVTDGYKALFKVAEVHENIKNTGTSAVRSVLGHFTYDQVISDRNELNKRLNTVIGNSIVNWGVECSRFEIQTFKPANREVERQLELQMEAERNRRKQLLDTQAQINIAEGQKQRVILESEGHLEAKSNEADASFKTVVREAEARQKQALLEASALASQVEELAKSIAKDKDHVQAEERQRALASLVELRRLEQLKAIAQSNSNSTYFFGDQAALGRVSESYNIEMWSASKSLVKKGR